MGSRTRAERLSWEHLVHSFQRSFLQNVLEKRMRLESVEHCKRSKSSECSREEEQQEHENREQQPRKRSKSIPRCKPARLNNRGWALARALRARARPFELEATPSFLPADNRGWAAERALGRLRWEHLAHSFQRSFTQNVF